MKIENCAQKKMQELNERGEKYDINLHRFSGNNENIFDCLIENNIAKMPKLN